MPPKAQPFVITIAFVAVCACSDTHEEPVCPKLLPVPGSDCEALGLSCEYAVSGYCSVTTTASCYGAWELTTSIPRPGCGACNPPSPLVCPAKIPVAGTFCGGLCVSGGSCKYAAYPNCGVSCEPSGWRVDCSELDAGLDAEDDSAIPSDALEADADADVSDSPDGEVDAGDGDVDAGDGDVDAGDGDG